MISTVRYTKSEYADGSGKKSIQYKTFETLEKAKEFISNSEADAKVRECQILVDYAEVDFYKKGFERMFESLLGGKLNAEQVLLELKG